MAQGQLQSEKADRRALINIRVSEKDRDFIDRAAVSLGKSRSEFMLEAARKAATEALLDTTLFRVDARTFARFQAMLDAPPKANDKLRALMRRKASWEQ